MTTLRTVQKIITPKLVQDGAGVLIKRFFPMQGVDQVDPFLLFDHFGSDQAQDYIAGFPMHPHRGIQTVTYMLEGRIKHQDSVGNAGSIEAGDVQWMSAGRGIMHEEMPETTEGKMSGFQLWVNLAATEKMSPPDYQDYQSAQIPEVITAEGHKARVISGSLLGQTGVVEHVSTQPIYADVHMVEGSLSLQLPKEHQAFVYVYEGSLSIDNRADDGRVSSAIQVKSPCVALLTTGEQLDVLADQPCRFMLAAGQAINEPMVRLGPFVMNTQEEINATVQELRRGDFPPV